MKLPIGGGRLTLKARNQYLEEDNARLRRDVKALASCLFDANERIRGLDNEIASLRAVLTIERQS